MSDKMERLESMLTEVTESEADHIFHILRSKFGWSGTVFSREDVESYLDRELTDEEWETVQNSYEWRKGVQDRMCERGWESIDYMCSSLELERGDDDD